MSGQDSSALPQIKPLDDYPQIIELMSQVTGKPRAEVIERFRLEELHFPYNVPTEFEQKQIPQGEWTDELLQFYRDTDSFLYETFVWNRHPLKQQIREWMADFLSRATDGPIKILCYGDGLGFESVFFSLLGHEVTYLEISDYGQKIVKELSQINGVTPTILSSDESLQPESFDAVVCLDVLEHLPEPTQQVAQFSQWLKPNGLLFASAPFFMVIRLFPTHLKSNLKYSGDVAKLYEAYGFVLLDGLFLWAPIALAKRPDLQTLKLASFWGKFKMFWGGLLLKAARVIPGPLNWIVQIPLRLFRTKKWAKELAAMQKAEQKQAT